MRACNSQSIGRRAIVAATLGALVVLAPRPTWAQDSLLANQAMAREPADGWQRGLEIGGLVTSFLNLGCGLKLKGRQDRKELGSEYDNNRNWHIGLAAATGGINLASAWQQWEINRKRQRREFRHSAHNALFWTNIAALAASSILGIASSRARGQSDLDSAHRLAIAMTATGFVSFGAVVIDVALFGGHDNATIIGPKIAF